MAEGKLLHTIKVKPANYCGPFRMLDGAAVPEDDGKPATHVQIQRIAGLFRLNPNRWGILADSVGLTAAQAEAILAHGRSGWHLNNELAESAGMVSAF